MYTMDLMVPELAYFFGFAQTDGHLRQGTRNRGSLSIGLSSKDRWILEQFVPLIPFNSSVHDRVADTNFKAAYHSSTLTVHALEFRTELNRLGIPYGRKSHLVNYPSAPCSEVDYFRGVIDADGALGITGKGFPFMSVVFVNEGLAYTYIAFLSKLLGKTKTTSRDKDGLFHLSVYKEDAQLLANTLYYTGCLALPRKVAKAREVSAWVRPVNMLLKPAQPRWTAAEDNFIVNKSLEEAVATLQRTEKSIRTRLVVLGSNVRHTI